MIISKKRLAVLLMSLLMTTACDLFNESDQGKKPAALHQVEAITASRQQVSHRQIVSGTLEAITSVRLYSEESGRITDLPYFEGDSVEKNAVVITLDDALIQAELDKATAQRQQAALDLRRLKKLLPKKLTSEEEVARAKTAFNVAKAEEQLQNTRLMRSQVKAPFAGVISQRNNESGDTVSAQSHILSMIDTTTMRVKVQISERWLPLMRKGDEVEVRIDAIGDMLHKGHISRIHPTIDPSTRKGTLEVKLEHVPENARAGQLAQVHIASQSTERLVIPSLAVHHDMDGAYAYLVKKDVTGKNKVAKHKLLKGSQYGKWVEIISGVTEGDKVIVKGFLGLRNNKEVQIVRPRNAGQNKIMPPANEPENEPKIETRQATDNVPDETQSIEQSAPEINLPQADAQEISAPAKPDSQNPEPQNPEPHNPEPHNPEPQKNTP